MASLKCPDCGFVGPFVKDGTRIRVNGETTQRFLCGCGYRFSVKDNLNTTSNHRKNSQVCVFKEAKNLTAVIEQPAIAGEKQSQLVKGEILQFAFYMQKEGLAKSTIAAFSRTMRRLAKISDLNNPESVKEAIGRLEIEENTKVSYCVAYNTFMEFLGKTWIMPKYTYRQKLPEFIPTELELDQLIAAVGRKTSCLLQLMKETGMRLGECLSLTWTAVNFQTNSIVLTVAEKHSLPRVFKVSITLLSMLGALKRTNEKLFGPMTTGTATTCLCRERKRVASKVGNPRITKIHFHLIRHWFGTMEYHKTHDIMHVKQVLGHKSVLNTQIYVNMEQLVFSGPNDEYHVKIVSTIEEAVSLLEVGFEYVTDLEGKKLFRKRK